LIRTTQYVNETLLEVLFLVFTFITEKQQGLACPWVLDGEDGL
jgi:hypothetical protein